MKRTSASAQITIVRASAVERSRGWFPKNCPAESARDRPNARQRINPRPGLRRVQVAGLFISSHAHDKDVRPDGAFQPSQRGRHKVDPPKEVGSRADGNANLQPIVHGFRHAKGSPTELRPTFEHGIGSEVRQFQRLIT